MRGTQLVITFDEDLDATSVPTKTFFLITISGIAGHHRPESVVVTGATVVLTLQAAHAVDASDMMLRVRYNAPKEEIGDAEVPITTNALKDLDGNLVKKWNPEFADYTPGTSSPSVPRGVYTESGNAQLTLHWSPVDDDGADIEKFQYQQITTGSFGATWTDIPDSGKPDPDTPGSGANFQSYTIGSGVANGTTYRYRLRAVNAAGAGPPSAEFTGRPVAAAASNTVTATHGSGSMLVRRPSRARESQVWPHRRSAGAGRPGEDSHRLPVERLIPVWDRSGPGREREMALDFLRQLGALAGRRAGYRLRRCPVRLPR